MKKFIIALHVLLFIIFNAHARFYIPEKYNAESFLKKEVLVELRSASAQELQTLNGIGETQYNTFIKQFNEGLTQAFKGYYKLGNEVLFKTATEIKALTKENPSAYAVIKTQWGKRTVQTIGAKVTYVNTYKVFDITASINGTDIFAVPMPSDILSFGDFIFIVQQFNRYIDAGAKGLKGKDLNKASENVELLTTKKTLLLPRNMLDPELAEDTLKVAKKYSFPHQVVEDDVVEETIKKLDGEYAYIMYIWSERNQNFAYVTVDATDGSILTIVTEGSINFTLASMPSKSDRQFETEATTLASFRNAQKDVGGLTLAAFRGKFAQFVNNK